MGKIIQNYSLQNELGSGVYSKVYKGVNNITNQQVAIKMIPAKKFKDIPKLQDGIINQINILTGIQRSPHIVKYYDMLKTTNNFYFVYEFCNQGTLEKLLSKVKYFSQKQAVIYFKQMLSAFRILNKHNIMHRDIKPQNILLHDGIIKLADFGFCKPLQSQDALADTMLGTPVYMAPQILRGQPYTMKADIWSLGTVLFKMLFGYCPFQSNNIAQLITTIESNDFQIPSNPPISSCLQQLLKKMIVKNPLYRIEWSQIFKYQFTEEGQVISSKNYLNYDKAMKNSTSSERSGDHDQQMRVSCKTSYSNSNSTDNECMDKSRNKQSNINGEEENSSPFKKIDSICKQHRDKKLESPKTATNLKNSQNAFEKQTNNFYSFGTHSNHESPNDGFHPRHHNTSNNYAPISGINDRYSKINVSIKNHHKCIDLINIALQISQYPYTEALMIGFFFIKTIKQELLTMHQSISKQIRAQYSLKTSNMQTHKNFIQTFQQQLQKIDQLIHKFSLEIPSSIFSDPKQGNPKTNLKKLLQFLKLQKTSELILITQLIAFVEDKMLIKRSTYDKLTNEQMARQIKLKIGKMNIE